MSKKVWFITGCSTGFGRELARQTLDLGCPTVITARRISDVEDLARGREHALVLALDVTDPGQISAAVEAARERFGRIDVLVNNAGIGCLGSFEETDPEAARGMFEVNVWGLAAMTRRVLPLMRAQRSGMIVNLSSIGGLAAFPALSFYNASKFAVEALSEALSLEAAPLGIKVLLVEPGPFRTEWAKRAAGKASPAQPDYAATAGARQEVIRGYIGQQPGDPVRAAAAIIRAVEAPEPPLRLLLGKLALSVARSKLARVQRDLDAWADVSLGADFPAQEPGEDPSSPCQG